jgi:TetR/AcrR family transcriptional regulator, transcriptional repressor for nem operon
MNRGLSLNSKARHASPVRGHQRAKRAQRTSSFRNQIKDLARDLLIQHGYHGMSYGDLATALKGTRANIHYHFGNKQELVEEVLDDYIELTLAQLREVWGSPGIPLVGKIERTAEHSRTRYLKYNRSGNTGRPWSLITRMRQDSDALTPHSREVLLKYGQDLYTIIVSAIEEAKARGEFVSWMPVEDVALQLVSIANSGGPITQDARNFERLEQLYMSFARIITLAFGRDRTRFSRSRRRRS